MVTGVLIRQKELAMLNADGISGKPIRKTIVWERMTYISESIILTATIGNLPGWCILIYTYINLENTP